MIGHIRSDHRTRAVVLRPTRDAVSLVADDLTSHRRMRRRPRSLIASLKQQIASACMGLQAAVPTQLQVLGKPHASQAKPARPSQPAPLAACAAGQPDR